MSDIKDIMQMDVTNLKKKQFDALKRHVLGELNLLCNCIENNRFTEAGAFLFDSPAGDGYGLDSTCINFQYDRTDDPLDIGDVIEKLESLNE